MLMKWTALVITFKPSARENIELAKQRRKQRDAVLLVEGVRVHVCVQKRKDKYNCLCVF